jgi:organic radical activating enzyme
VHCVDACYDGKQIVKPDVQAISKTIIDNIDGLDDVLFLGGEPCLFLEDRIKCIEILKDKTALKLYVTTSVPKVCYDHRDRFEYLIELLDGLNISAQHYDEKIADQILKLLDKLEEHDDVQNVYANFDISDEIMQKLEG